MIFDLVGPCCCCTRVAVWQEGIFTAWNFTKATKTENANWQLLAAYLGSQSTTQGLLLVNKNNGDTMEIMAQDCAWRVKHHDSWSKAQVELVSSKDGATSFDIKKIDEKLGNSAAVQSTILMNMKSQHTMREVAELVVHCKPRHHLDFKIKMYHKDDIKHVGGELGVDPDAKSSYRFLFSKQGVIDMRTDHEFEAGVKDFLCAACSFVLAASKATEAAGTWVTLGGRAETAEYLEFKQSAGANLLESSCSEAQEEDAKAICAKYLEATRHPDVFADCVFDVCHGGDETFAQNAAAFIAA
eukprot:Skav213106  [mRNA]  locus=scaffold403:13608:14667:+ [translate_table: standard]